VPKAAIDKDGQPFAAKNKIRLAEKRMIPPPARDSRRAHDGGQLEFRILVAAGTYRRHDFGTLGFGENVCHEEILTEPAGPRQPETSIGGWQD
jgi:hypothetical protein